MWQQADLLQDPLRDSYSRSVRSKSNRPSPSSVQVPKLDLPLPPASPRRRGSTAADDELQSFMPLTPAPITPRLAPASAANLQYSPHIPTARPVVDHTSPATCQAHSQHETAAAVEIDMGVPECSVALQPLLEAPDNSQQAPQPASTASARATVEAVTCNPQNQTADQQRMLVNAPVYPAGSLHHKAMKSPDGSKSNRPRSPSTPKTPASAATSELSQVYPRSWNGTPRASQLNQADPASSAGQQAGVSASDEATLGGPDAHVDGQYTLQQLLARNEVCSVSQGLFLSCLDFEYALAL